MALKRRVNKLKAIGIDYEFAAPSSASTPDNKKVAAAKEKAEDDVRSFILPSKLFIKLFASQKADATDVAAPLPVKRKMVVKTAKPKVTRVKGRMPPPKKAKKTRK
ncbi:unnamed protein product [Heligmosomoides polygyrus]|uniref:Histone H1 n=1 Tax=Heligmosomoides polygyrus TaxID=6339 RepID=A0A183GJP5_HELPZ|nr:unnamed protein product [Heligmosomoides polygyrus]